MDQIRFNYYHYLEHAKTHQLLAVSKGSFKKGKNKHNLFGICMFNEQLVQTTGKIHCISLKGVSEEIKHVNHLGGLKIF